MSSNDLEKALEPQQQKKNPVKYIILAVFALIIIAGGFWLSRQFLEKGEVEIPLPREVAQAVSENLRLDDGKLGPVRITPSESGSGASSARPGQGAAQQGQQGQAGQSERPSASGLIVGQGRSATDLVEIEAPGETRQKIYSGSDAVVTINFASDLAEYLAENYWPKGTHIAAKNSATSSASLGGAGQRYGIELTGFASTRPEGQRDYLRDRALVLNYAYMPAMVEALTRLYADRFVDDLAAAGLKQIRGGAPMSEAEVAEMLRFYARYARSLNAALGAYLGAEDAAQVVHGFTLAQDNTFQANVRFHEAQYRVENAREEQKARELRDAQQDMKSAEQEYRKAMLEQERAKEAVLAFMGRGASRRLDDQELLYIAAWAARRGEGASGTHQAAASSADFLAQVLEEKAAELE